MRIESSFPSQLLLLVSLAGCASAAPRTDPGRRDLSPEAALEAVTKALENEFFCPKPTALSVTYRKIERACAKDVSSRRTSIRITASPRLVVKRDADLWIPMRWVCPETMTGTDYSDCLFLWKGGSAQATATAFLNAWSVLARSSDPAEEAAFKTAAEAYVRADPKPELPEEAVKYKAQAEFAIEQKRFGDAVSLFEKALAVAPWWPAGRYNLGLILGELEDYPSAVRELRKYLELEPSADNGRAVQMKIYQWESLAPEGPGR